MDLKRLYTISKFYNISRKTAEKFYYNIYDIKYHKRYYSDKFNDKEWSDLK